MKMKSMILKKSDKSNERFYTILFSIGLISLPVAIMMEILLADNYILNFFIGFLLGLSMVFNLVGLYRVGLHFRQKRKSDV